MPLSPLNFDNLARVFSWPCHLPIWCRKFAIQDLWTSFWEVFWSPRFKPTRPQPPTRWMRELHRYSKFCQNITGNFAKTVNVGHQSHGTRIKKYITTSLKTIMFHVQLKSCTPIATAFIMAKAEELIKHTTVYTWLT